MYKILRLLILIIPVSLHSQKSFTVGTYIAVPDKDTYTNLELWYFKADKLIIKDLLTKNRKTYSYNVDKERLILSNNIGYENIKINKDSFKISGLNYVKLYPTLVEDSKEVDLIKENSCWTLNSKKNKENFCFSKRKSSGREEKELNTLIKVENTYILIVFNRWAYPIKRISREKIELYRVPELNEFVLIRDYSHK